MCLMWVLYVGMLDCWFLFLVVFFPRLTFLLCKLLSIGLVSWCTRLRQCTDAGCYFWQKEKLATQGWVYVFLHVLKGKWVIDPWAQSVKTALHFAQAWFRNQLNCVVFTDSILYSVKRGTILADCAVISKYIRACVAFSGISWWPTFLWYILILYWKIYLYWILYWVFLCQNIILWQFADCERAEGGIEGNVRPDKDHGGPRWAVGGIAWQRQASRIRCKHNWCWGGIL